MKVPPFGNPRVDRADVIAGPWRLQPSKQTPQRGETLIGRRTTLGLHRLLACWRERVRERRRLRSLSTLDDQLLRDIGFTRSELLHEASKPFWRAGAVPPEKDHGDGKATACVPCRIVYRVTRSHLTLPVRLSLTPSSELRAFGDVTLSGHGRAGLSRAELSQEDRPFSSR